MNGVTSFGDDIQCSEINTSSFLMKGTDIDMQSKKITNCAECSEEDDVVTIKGLNAYYRKGTALDMQNQRITSVAAGTDSTDAANVGQTKELVKNLMYVKEGIFAPPRPANNLWRIVIFSEVINTPEATCSQPNRNSPISAECYSHPHVIPLSLFINTGGELLDPGISPFRTFGEKWVQEPFILAGKAIYFRGTPNLSPNTRYLFFYFMSPGATATSNAYTLPVVPTMPTSIPSLTSRPQRN